MENDLVSPGDTIEVGVTHEVLIGREKSWVKYGVVTKVREGETGEQASERASIQMNEEVEKIIKDIVEQVDRIEGETR
jgi:hypothetical protein